MSEKNSTIVSDTIKGKALRRLLVGSLGLFSLKGFRSRLKEKWSDLHTIKESKESAGEVIGKMSDEDYKQSLRFYSIRSWGGAAGVLYIVAYVSAAHNQIGIQLTISCLAVCFAFACFMFANRFRVWQLKNKEYGSFTGFMSSPSKWFE